jgi:hypothetical protein
MLPRTRERLAEFGEVTLSGQNVHAWQFLNVANPRSLLDLRDLRIDWSMILRDAITDVSLTRGKEDVLGIAERRNPANRAHIRLGFSNLMEKREFTSDGGNAASIKRRSFSNPI